MLQPLFLLPVIIAPTWSPSTYLAHLSPHEVLFQLMLANFQMFGCCCFFVLYFASGFQDPLSLFKLLQYTSFDDVLRKEKKILLLRAISRSPVSQFIFHWAVIFRPIWWKTIFLKLCFDFSLQSKNLWRRMYENPGVKL